MRLSDYRFLFTLEELSISQSLGYDVTKYNLAASLTVRGPIPHTVVSQICTRNFFRKWLRRKEHFLLSDTRPRTNRFQSSKTIVCVFSVKSSCWGFWTHQNVELLDGRVPQDIFSHRWHAWFLIVQDRLCGVDPQRRLKQVVLLLAHKFLLLVYLLIRQGEFLIERLWQNSLTSWLFFL